MAVSASPVLPFWGDVVVANVGWVAQEEGGAADFREGEGAVVGYVEAQAGSEAEDGGVGAEDLCSERVDLDGKEFGVREGAGGGEEKAPGAGAGVDDP